MLAFLAIYWTIMTVTESIFRSSDDSHGINRSWIKNFGNVEIKRDVE